MFIVALPTIAEIRKQLKCPSTDEWIKKMWEIYIRVCVCVCVCVCAHASIWTTTLPIVRTWKDMEGTTLNEIS